MKTRFEIRILILASILLPAILSAEETLEWPEGVEAKITEILKIKEDAVKLPNMRSENGVLGKRSEILIDEIGKMITDPKLIQKAKNREKYDIKSKIVIWALDRKNRQQEYTRFAKYYVNKPSEDEAAEYFFRPFMKYPPDPFADPKEAKDFIPRPGAWIPNSVDKEDQKENYRPILEYNFYVPPTGSKFDEDLYRAHLINALFELRHYERSMIVMASDAEMALSSGIQHEAHGREVCNGYDPLHFMTRVSTTQSFSMISKMWKNEPIQVKIQTVFNEAWKDSFLENKYQAAKQSFDAWQELAGENWVAPEELELSKWILSRDPPRKLVTRMGSVPAE